MANTIGQIILGSSFPTHPIFGQRRDVLVEQISSVTGRWTLGTITCRDCEGERQIHPGDHFQVMQCVSCKDAERKAAKAAARANSPETAERIAEKAAAKAARDAKAAADKAAKAAARALRNEETRKAKEILLAEKEALKAKVAAEKGVAVSA